MTEAQNLQMAERYIACLSSGAAPEDLDAFFAVDFLQEEFPNRLLPNGATRDLRTMKEARVRGRALLKAEAFEVMNALATGDRVAMEVIWTGTVGVAAGPFVAGQELRARFAVFMDFRDGRIVRQRNLRLLRSW